MQCCFMMQKHLRFSFIVSLYSFYMNNFGGKKWVDTSSRVLFQLFVLFLIQD